MSKNSSVKEYFYQLRTKKIISISDIDKIGEYFFNYIKTAEEQFLASREISNFKQKIPHQLLALENISKPLILSNLIPPPLQKWEINDEDFKIHIKATSDHEYKQLVSGNYGKTLGFLKYENWIPHRDLNMLQVIKEKYQHSDSDFPYSNKQAKRLALKLDKFLEERLYSKNHIGLLDLYKTLKKSKTRVREISLSNFFPFTSQYFTFAESIEDTNTDYEELAIKAKLFDAKEVKFDEPFTSVIFTDEDSFTKDLLEELREILNQMKIVDAQEAVSNMNQKTSTGLRNIKTIIKNSSK